MTHIHVITFQECKQLVLCSLTANTQLMSSCMIKAAPFLGRIEVHFKSSFPNSKTQLFINATDLKLTKNDMKICGIFEMTKVKNLENLEILVLSICSCVGPPYNENHTRWTDISVPSSHCL